MDKKKYTLEMSTNEKGALSVKSSNDGFTSLEIMGLFDWKAKDILAQIRGSIVPDIVERKIVKDKKK